MDHPFRNAMFGGFNRQDVLTYLENAAQEAARQQQEFQRQLEQAQELSQRQESALAELQEQAGLLTQENGDLKARLERTAAELSASQARQSQTAAELEEALDRERTLVERLAALEPDALAYAAIKERAAGVELDAHRRAQAVQEVAEDQARQLRRSVEHWLRKVEREYGDLRSQVEATISHAADQLSRAGRDLEQVTALLEERDVELDGLARTYSEGEQAKAAPPMPIPED